MNLLEEIREHFALLTSYGVRKLLVDDVEAWTIIKPEFFGVAIHNVNELDVFEKFTNVKIFNDIIPIDNISTPVIIMSSDITATKREFSTLCSQFAERGINNENRMLIQEDIYAWIDNWKNLLGNSLKKKLVYDVIAELLVVEHLYKEGIKPYWSGSDMGIRDIETSSFILDVKASTNRFDTNISISSQYQLIEDKPLYIYFCRLEKTKTFGESINSVVQRIGKMGIDLTEIETKLLSMNFHVKSNERNLMFNVLERKKYKVDGDFPVIIPESFVGGIIPKYISKIQYTVNLAGVKSGEW